MPGDWEAAELMRGMQGASSALAVCGVTYGAQSLRFKAETCCLPGMSLNLFFFLPLTCQHHVLLVEKPAKGVSGQQILGCCLGFTAGKQIK